MFCQNKSLACVSDLCSDALSEDEPSGDEDAEHALHTAIPSGQSGAAKGSLSGASSTTAAAAVPDGSGDSLDLEVSTLMITGLQVRFTGLQQARIEEVM